MKKVCLLALAVLLAAAASLSAWLYMPAPPPVYAQTISITLTGGISFGNITPPASQVDGDLTQTDGSPAIVITIATETDVVVDVGIKGTITSGDLALSNWFYSTQFDKGDITSLTGAYVEVYPDQGPPSGSPIPLDFYHWITVPEGTAAGSHTVNVSYKAIQDDTSF